MQTNKRFTLSILLILALLTVTVMLSGCTDKGSQNEVQIEAQIITITDALGREVTVPKSPDRVICSGSSSLRYLTYLEAQDKIVAVDSIEARKTGSDARPYAIANPQFKGYPVFGEFRGNDDPEKILSLDPRPQVIFKIDSKSGYDPVELQAKTGIPVVVVKYGNLVTQREDMYQALRIMGTVMGKEERAKDVTTFIDNAIADLDKRTRDVPAEKKTTCYVGGIARAGPHGFQSTEPTYPPFHFTNAKNVAYDPKNLTAVDVTKESILGWDPEVIFVDLSTTQSEDKSSALYQLKTDPAYRKLKAVKSGEVYGVLPYNWYNQNQCSILVNAYFAGKLLYPDKFEDVDLDEKAIEIYTFMVGKGNKETGSHVYNVMNKAFAFPAFTKLDVS